jgi:hypothetical protein
MATDHSPRALRPVESDAGVLIHPASDRRLAAEHWLLSTLPRSGWDRARMEWRELGIALLPLGGLMSAVRVPGRLIQAIAATEDPAAVDAFLADALDGGPVICDRQGPRYYALVPGSTPRTWHEAAEEWRGQDVEVLGRETVLGVPRVDADKPMTPGVESYWSVPMASAGVLCRPLAVARVIAAGRHAMTDEAQL